MDELEQLRRENEALRTKTQSLTGHVEQLQSANARLVEEAKSLVASQQDLSQEKSRLQHQLQQKQDELDALIRRLYGRQSERFEGPDQLRFEFATEAEIEDAREGVQQALEDHERERAGKKKNNKPRRRRRDERFPESLPRQEMLIDLPEDEKAGLQRIGEDVVESAHYRRGEVYIIRKVFPKYVRQSEPEAGVLQASRPPALLAGDRYDVSFAAAVVANRLGYHLPIYRQEDMFAECGLHLTRSTLLNIQEASERTLRPFCSWLADLVRTDSCIGSDDTSVRLLLPEEIPRVREEDPKSGRVAEVFEAAKSQGLKSITAKMWAYRGVSIPVNVFDFTVSRHRDGPDLFLVDHGYEGTLLGDCYGANTGIYMRSSGLITHAACVAHARRKVEAAMGNHPLHAKHLLGLFRLLYDVEDEARGKSAAERLSLRQSRSVGVWQRLHRYLDTQMKDCVSTDKIQEARSYILNQWAGLQTHLADGGIPIDNNQCEQLMKQVALGRKNWLHLGSLKSGYRTANLMTIVSTAVRNDLDVAAYLEDILHELLRGNQDFESLRPDVWAKSHPESIRAYRQQQREAHNFRRERTRLHRRLARLAH